MFEPGGSSGDVGFTIVNCGEIFPELPITVYVQLRVLSVIAPYNREARVRTCNDICASRRDVRHGNGRFTGCDREALCKWLV